jgi:hypothetical protein
MSLVRWRFSLALGIVAVVLEGVSVALIFGSHGSFGSTLSVLTYGLFPAAIPYLATTQRQQWWLSTATTLAVAWLLTFLLTVPAEFLGTSVVASGDIDTYFVVAHRQHSFLLIAAAGVAALAILSWLVGSIARYVVRSPAA